MQHVLADSILVLYINDGSASLSQKSLGEVRPRFPGENFGDSFMTYIDQLMMPKWSD